MHRLTLLLLLLSCGRTVEPLPEVVAPPVPWPIPDGLAETLVADRDPALRAITPNDEWLRRLAWERGRSRAEKLVNRRDCHDCHRADLGGAVLEDSFWGGRVVAPNLTYGEGGLAESMTDEDWVRLLRLGLTRRGTRTHEPYPGLTERDVSDIIVYCRSQSPANRDLGARREGWW